MSIVAGMDLGYGSQVKVVTTNYLVVNVGSNPTDAGASNFLQLANDALVTGTTDSDGRQKAFQFDYIMCDGNAPTITSPTVIDATGGTISVPVHGPSPGVLGGGSTATASADATAIGRSANGVILAVLSAAAGTVLTNETATLSTLDTAATVNLAGLTDDASVASHLQGELLKAQLTGASLQTIDVADIVAEFAGGDALTAIDLSVAGVNADFVAKGNAAGTTATTLGTVTADGNKLGVISITALVRTSQ